MFQRLHVACWLVLLLVAAMPVHADTGTEIVIGAVLTLEDDADGAGHEVLAGLQRAVETLNGLGGIEVAGTSQPVRLEVFDDHGSDRRAYALARVLVLRRGATVVIAGSRPSAGIAMAPVGAEFRVPMVDVIGLPATEAPGEVPYRFSVLPSLEDRWMPALTLAVLVRRMQGTDTVPFSLITADPILETAARRVAAGWGLGANGDLGAPGDGVVLLLDRAASWPDDVMFGAGIVIVPACDDARRLRERRPAGAILCTGLWRGDAHPGATEVSVSAEIAVLAVAQAVERGRSAYGSVLRDILMLLNAETPAGPIRFGADGHNAALAARLYSVEPDGLYEIDPADPSSLWRDVP